ncbi:mitochondrial large ribosomal subunit protein uL15m [bacterium]|nr:mitochondrial large ribosomal subunit protein uL15m [bacterium]
MEMSPVNLDKIQDWINQRRIDPTRPITVKELAATRVVHGVKDGIKLLARGADSAHLAPSTSSCRVPRPAADPPAPSTNASASVSRQ